MPCVFRKFSFAHNALLRSAIRKTHPPKNPTKHICRQKSFDAEKWELCNCQGLKSRSLLHSFTKTDPEKAPWVWAAAKAAQHLKILGATLPFAGFGYTGKNLKVSPESVDRSAAARPLATTIVLTFNRCPGCTKFVSSIFPKLEPIPFRMRPSIVQQATLSSPNTSWKKCFMKKVLHESAWR